MLSACLQRYPLFALLSTRQLDDWLATGKELTFTTGETIFQEGTAGVWAHLVLEGRVRIVRRTKTDREVTLGTVGPGGLFGEYALLPPHRNTATCRAADPVRLLRLPLPSLCKVLATYPEIVRHLKRWLRLHTLLGYLRERAFLGFLSAESALKYLEPLRSETFQALRTIQSDGLADDHWYFIEKGTVALQATGERARELGPGDCFGERALAGWQDLPVAVALEETRCQCLPRSAFDPSTEVAAHTTVQTVKSLGDHAGPRLWVGQQEEADCGVAALAMVANYHRLEVPLQELRRRVRLDGQGMSALALLHLAEAVGLIGRAVRADPAHLADVALPAIAHWTNGHFVVMFERGPCQLVVGDPATGLVTLSEAEFRQQWSGCLLLLAAAGGR